MIIFIQKSTGKIIGYIAGRVHSDELLKAAWMQTDDIEKEDVGKYVVPLEDKFADVEEPVYDFVEEIKGSNKFVRKQVGTQITRKVVEQVPSGPLKDLALLSEAGNLITSQYIVLIEGQKVTGYKKIDITTPEQQAENQNYTLDLKQSADQLKVLFPTVVQTAMNDISQPVTVKEVGFDDRDWLFHVIENCEMTTKDRDIARRLCSMREPFLAGALRMYVAVNDQQAPVAGCLIRVVNRNYVYYLGGVTELGKQMFAFEKLIWGIVLDAQTLGFENIDLAPVYRQWSISID